MSSTVDYVRTRADIADNALAEAQAAYDRSIPKSVRLKLEMARNGLQEAIHDLEYEQVMEAENDREQREGR